MKTIIVCCGSSMITSTVARKKIEEYMKTQGIEVKVIQCKFAEVAGNIDMYHPDLIVPTGSLKPELAKGVPVIKGTPFITGIGEQETLAQIKETLTKE
jgi:PTS system galactitol-specific IIB component